MSLFAAFTALLKRDFLLSFRNRKEIVNTIVFFIVIVSLFPLGVGPYPEKLQAIGAGVIWIAALLATLLRLDDIFRSDFDDGTLEQLMLSGHPTFFLIFAKLTAHWIVTGVPLILFAPILGSWMYLPWDAVYTLVITLLIGTPVLTFVGGIGVALTVGLKKGGVLLALLVLPLYIPTLIFAANAVDGALAGMNVNMQLYCMGAILALAVTFTPFATAAALRISMS